MRKWLLLGLLWAPILDCRASTAIVLAGPPTIIQYTVSEDSYKVELTKQDSKTIIIRLTGYIQPSTAGDFDKVMNEAMIDNPDTILFYIDSVGGDCEAGFKIQKSLEKAGSKLNCVVTGRAMSMAFYLLQTCPKREILPTAILMVHEPNSGPGSIQSATRFELQRRAAALGETAAKMSAVESKRMGITKQQLDTKIQDKDWSMDPDEALDAGAVDEILTPSR